MIGGLGWLEKCDARSHMMLPPWEVLHDPLLLPPPRSHPHTPRPHPHLPPPRFHHPHSPHHPHRPPPLQQLLLYEITQK